MTEILHLYIEYVLTIFWAFWSEWLLGLFVAVCSLVDFLGNIFNVFAGISPVQVGGRQTYLLDAFFQMQEVTTAFAYITVMAVAISFIFTIVKTAKSISDMALENKNPISKVLADGMKAAVTFMLIPFLCITLLQLSTIVTNQVVSAFNIAQGGSSSIGTIVFLSAGLDADKATTNRRNVMNMDMQADTSGRNPSMTDDVRLPYLEGRKDYRKLSQVKRDFYAANFNYVEGFASALLLLFILAGAVIVFAAVSDIAFFRFYDPFG